LQSKLIIDIKENEIVCPNCKGLRFVLIEKSDKGYIESCQRCYAGKVNICKHCGNDSKLSCQCGQSKRERDTIFCSAQAQKELDAYNQAEKISFNDYNGKFLLESDDYVKDKDDIEEWIYEKLNDGEDVPDYLWATKAEKVFTIDLLDIISNNCEDGYEDMYDHLSTDSDVLVQAQQLITKWEETQGESLNFYTTTLKKAVIIKDLVDEIKKELETT
jgi:hypothetical protein